MDPKHKDLLRVNGVKFVHGLICDPVLMAHLQSNNTLTLDMSARVLSEVTPGDKASALLAILVRRGPQAFNTFCEALMESCQEELCKIIDIDFANNWGQKPTISLIKDPKEAESGSMNITIIPCEPSEVQALIHSPDVYKMSASTRGRAIIICNTYFMSQRFTEREGARFDLDNLDRLFKGLGFTTTLYENRTAQRMKEIILKESRNPDNDKADVLIMFLLTHGAQGKVYGVDGEAIDIEEDVAACFDANNCPALKEKPKLLFIQACQGKVLPEGIPQSDGGNEEEDVEIFKQLEKLTLQENLDNIDCIPAFKKNGIHEKADFLMAYSTVPGYKSWRLPDLGSWFVRAICQVFSTYAHKEHITELLTRVRKIVAEQGTIGTDDHFKQITETRETLTKKFYFFPGLPRAV